MIKKDNYGSIRPAKTQSPITDSTGDSFGFLGGKTGLFLKRSMNETNKPLFTIHCAVQNLLSRCRGLNRVLSLRGMLLYNSVYRVSFPSDPEGIKREVHKQKVDAVELFSTNRRKQDCVAVCIV